MTKTKADRMILGKKGTDLIGVMELSKYLGLNRDTIYRELKTGSLPGFRVGVKIWRFRVSEIDAWINKRGRNT